MSHPDLNVYKQVTFVSGTSTGNDDNGHGTSVAGIAAAKDNSAGVVGIAPGARLWAIKVLANNGIGMSSDIIKGIDYATEHANEIDVVNLSFGGEGTNVALHDAIINSVAAGVTYVAAAGNEGKDASSFVPASFPEVIAVSAIVDNDGKCGGLSSISTSSGKDDTFASFSNYGSVIDMAAPGVQIKTTARGSSYTSSFTGTRLQLLMLRVQQHYIKLNIRARVLLISGMHLVVLVPYHLLYATAMVMVTLQEIRIALPNHYCISQVRLLYQSQNVQVIFL